MATTATTAATSSTSSATLDAQTAAAAKRASAQKIITSLSAGSGVDVPAEAQLRTHSHGTANEEPPRAQENPFGHRLPPVVVDALGQWYPFPAVQGAQ